MLHAPTTPLLPSHLNSLALCFLKSSFVRTYPQCCETQVRVYGDELQDHNDIQSMQLECEPPFLGVYKFTHLQRLADDGGDVEIVELAALARNHVAQLVSEPAVHKRQGQPGG